MKRPSGPTANLPRQFTPFVGRDQELAEITRLLADPACVLLTLLGPGGAGKTRLAIEAASRMATEFGDGIYFVPLQAVEATELLVTAIIDAINLSLYGQETPRQQLLDYLRDQEMLLLLDNFEQLLTGSSIDLLLNIFERCWSKGPSFTFAATPAAWSRTSERRGWPSTEPKPARTRLPSKLGSTCWPPTSGTWSMRGRRDR
jgi:hypothetical protein